MPLHRSLIAVLLSLLLFVNCKKNSSSSSPNPTNQFFIKGVDLSFSPEIATWNIPFSENGTAKPILTIMKDKGINTIRLRLWNNPSTNHSNLQEVMQFAQQIKAQ